MTTKTLNIKHSNNIGVGGKVEKNSILASFFSTLLVWQERANMRYQLPSMSKENLSDIGLTKKDLLIEIRKPFWQN